MNETQNKELLAMILTMFSFLAGKPVWTRKLGSGGSGWSKMTNENHCPVWDWYNNDYTDNDPGQPCGSTSTKSSVLRMAVSQLPLPCYFRWRNEPGRVFTVNALDHDNQALHISPIGWLSKSTINSHLAEFSGDGKKWTEFTLA